jgi:hypothetical protein
MNSLSELRDFLVSKEIEIKEFNGWLLKVDKDTWVLDHGVFYKNGYPQSLKEKGLFDKYIKKETEEFKRRSAIKMINSSKFIDTGDEHV